MAPTAFKDFADKASTLFDEHHNAGKNSFTKSGKIGGGDYSLTLENAHGDSNVAWTFETNACKNASISVDSDSNISHEVNFNVKQVQGLSLKINPSFNPNSGLNFGDVNANFQNDKINFNIAADVPALGNLKWDLSADVKALPFTVGFGGSYNLKSGECSGVNYGWTKSNEDFEVSFVGDDVMKSHKGTFSLFKKLEKSSFCCVGVQANTVSNTVAMALAEGSCCGDTKRYKIDNNGTLSFASVKSLNSSVKMNISAVLNAKDLSNGGHNFGVGFSFC